MNETAWKTIGNASLDDKNFQEKNVIGVVKDIHVTNLHQKIVPTFFVLDNESHTYLTLRILPGDIQGTINYVEKVWQEIAPDFVLDLRFYDDWIHTSYKTEEHIAYAIQLFAIIAIVIACLGTFGVIQFMTLRRTKEIGIRKVSGAKTSQIILLLNSEFIKWISIAFILAAPISWAILKFWLQFFAYRIDITIWPFLLAGLIALVIAMLTVSWQTIRAAMANPVESLRYE
jgi:putative ABC transport system permease protein